MSRGYLVPFHRQDTETQRGKPILQVGKLRLGDSHSKAVPELGFLGCSGPTPGQPGMAIGWDVCNLLTL